MKRPASLREARAGDRLPELRRQPTTVDLFAYSAVTWNKAPIHFDQDFARSKGYRNVLVHSHLHGAYLAATLTAWVGDPRLVRSMSVTVRRPAFAGDVLICGGVVTAAKFVDGNYVIDVDLEERREEDAEPCAFAKAQVVVPGEV